MYLKLKFYFHQILKFFGSQCIQFKLWILEVLLVVRMVNFYSCEDPTFSSSIQSHDDILYINKEIVKHVTFD